jgi:transglutaminase-like putative cysteine protease
MKPPYRHFSIAALLCVLFLNVFSQKVSVGPTPSWVTANTFDPLDEFGIEDAENGYLDLLFEYQVNAAPASFFTRTVMKVLNESGIEAVSKVTVSYDPTYQNLRFHTVRVLRDGKEINQLNPAKIKTVSQETDLDRNLYNGSFTAMIILEDIRKGDVIDYSYSINGSNPVFKGRFSRSFELAYSIPIGNIYYKAICPANRSLTLKTIGSDIQPTIQKNAENQIYEWKIPKAAAVRSQERVPSWHTAYGFALLSEYSSWKDVNDWALQLFPEQKNISPALKEKIKSIQSDHTTIEEQIGTALRFVQDEIRYMGIEVGSNSHQPAHPDKIFAQRYGDCKDKTYLLCTMLKEMNVEAYPVLINTYYTKGLLDWTASASAFDHVIVLAKVNGKNYWFDPTISYQRGKIHDISFPDYKVGLVISPQTTELTTIDNKEPGEVDVEEVFNIKKDGSATFIVTTRYTGTFADDTRSAFKGSSRYEMLKSYRDYYQSYHDKIEGDSLSYEEEPATGAFLVKEYYSFENIWEMIDGKKKIIFSPYIIIGLIRKPSSTKRDHPFSIAYPAKYHEKLVINMADEWDIEQENDYITTDAFRIHHKTTYNNKQLILDYNYEAKEDHVLPKNFPEYVASLEKINNQFSFHITANSELTASTRSSSPTFYYAVLGLVIIAAGAWYFTWRK